MLSACKNFIHTKVYTQGSTNYWYLTCIYGCPTFVERRGLWQKISALCPNNNSPWCYIGDFNEILCQDDKDGVLPHSQNQIDIFRSFVDRNLLLDMVLKGCRWCNNRHDGCVREKIDRIMVNANWLDCFPNAYGEALPAIGSDHSPIVLHCDVAAGKRKKHFVYEHFWDEHPDCASLVAEAWNKISPNSGGVDIKQRIDDVKSGLSVWSHRTFKRAGRQINFLKKEIRRLQNVNATAEVLSRLSSHKKELDDLWKQEELYWRARSRVKWLNNGDRNSKFFHSSTLQRRMTNKIGRIKDGNGDWVAEDDKVLTCFVDFYKNLFSTDAMVGRNMNTEVIPSLVTDQMNTALLSQVTETEVERAAFEMGPYKSPGPDGLNGLFSKRTDES